MRLGFANASGNVARRDLVIDGSRFATISLPSGNDWRLFDAMSLPTSLPAGVHTVRIETPAAAMGRGIADVDWLDRR